MSIRIGHRVECLITGFTGIATARMEDITGDVQFAVTPKSRDGKYPGPVWISEVKLKKIEGGVMLKPRKRRFGFATEDGDAAD